MSWRHVLPVKERDVIYRQLGRTGLKVSQLGFGAMRLPMTGEGDARRVDDSLAVPLIHRAFEAGVNYIDSAVFYNNGDSQRAVGEALKGWRDRVVVSTKNNCLENDERAWWKNLEDSLRLLQIDTIDLYHTHGITWKRWQEAIDGRITRWLLKARDQKMIRHIATSVHDEVDKIPLIINTGFYEAITIQYNMLNRRHEESLALAHEKGMGVIVMGPLAGGMLGVQNEVLAKLAPGERATPELALRFVLANPNVTIALSGMQTAEIVDANVAIANDPVSLTAQDYRTIADRLGQLRGLADLYCTGCNYCMPCPAKVAIPTIFSHRNLQRVYGLDSIARKNYAGIDQGTGEDKPAKADACTDCGLCETKCPQKLPIRQQLKEAHEAMNK